MIMLSLLELAIILKYQSTLSSSHDTLPLTQLAIDFIYLPKILRYKQYNTQVFVGLTGKICVSFLEIWNS